MRIYTGSGYEDFKLGKHVKASYITQDDLGLVRNIRLEGSGIVITFQSGDVFYYHGLNFRAQL